ncbi:hypothetical protein [Hymenobacter chitinivorans]|uniref:Uncharacterized protein n=1 Tax=Hymenobacter chitinivorans DSM 11115 TaxID=1121954 RepID=A0A2M9BAD0_9BACT|nr:hypothetical protein [Hymenobacter chitinivorans]PJJ54899.1 hypothetical protein CLV45_3245 [Hymenobacter chitinivorans DSM 11115]
MKNVLHLLTGFTLATFSTVPALATPGPALSLTASGGQNPTADQSCQVRALQLSCYYASALRLSISQAAAVKQATTQELEQLSQLNEAITAPNPAKAPAFTTEQVQQQYDAAMLQILTPGQYSAFHLLQERQAGQMLQLSGHVARK